MLAFVILGMLQDSQKQRWTLKISKDASLEEMQDAIRAATGDPTLEIDKEWFDQFMKLDEIERERREKMIQLLGPLFGEFFSREDNEGLKRKREINDILNYIQFAGDDDWKIVKMSESPDFILEVNGEMIGLELTGLYDRGIVAQVSKRAQVCAKTEEALRSAYPEMTGLINVVFDAETSKDLPTKVIVPELIIYLEAKLKGENLKVPVFIRSVDIKPQAELQVALAENYTVKKIDTSVLDNLIAQKESKISTYRENANLSTIWLLVILDGASEKSAPEFTLEMLPRRKFAFDKVIVYDSFKQIGVSAPPPGR